MHAERAELLLEQTLARVCRRRGARAVLTCTEGGVWIEYNCNYRRWQRERVARALLCSALGLSAGWGASYILALAPGGPSVWTLLLAGVLALAGALVLYTRPEATPWVEIKAEVERELAGQFPLVEYEGRWTFFTDSASGEVIPPPEKFQP